MYSSFQNPFVGPCPSMPLRRKIKNSVGQATSNDPSLPSQEILLQIADMTKSQSLFTDTVAMIWKRLNDKCKNWRHIYKSLIVIEACLRYGSFLVSIVHIFVIF